MFRLCLKYKKYVFEYASICVPLSAVCWLHCQNGGVCQRPNTCSCPEGWMGRLCEERKYLAVIHCLTGTCLRSRFLQTTVRKGRSRIPKMIKVNCQSALEQNTVYFDILSLSQLTQKFEETTMLLLHSLTELPY